MTTRLQPGVAAYSRIYASAGARPTYLWEGIIGMLIEFSVANFRSILSRQTLGLGANAKDSHLARNVASAARTSAAYFGPPLSMVRAAGKSKLLRALLFLYRAIACRWVGNLPLRRCA